MAMNSNQQQPAKPFGLQDQMTSNNQQGLPLAYVAGTRKIAVKWFTPIYNLRSAPAPNQGGKK